MFTIDLRSCTSTARFLRSRCSARTHDDVARNASRKKLTSVDVCSNEDNGHFQSRYSDTRRGLRSLSPRSLSRRDRASGDSTKADAMSFLISEDHLTLTEVALRRCRHVRRVLRSFANALNNFVIYTWTANSGAFQQATHSVTQ